MVDSNGVYHLVIYIGIDGGKGGPGYPSAWSFVEEGRNWGTSRKLSRVILSDPNFYKLTSGVSRQVLVHPRALPLFGFGLARQNRPLVGCKLFNHFAENQDWWHTNLGEEGISGHHPKTMELIGNYDLYPEPCTLALRDLSMLNHTLNEDVELLEPIQYDWVRFQVKSGSSLWTGNVPGYDIEPVVEGYGIQWASAAFLSLPLHFEIPKADVHNIAGKVAQAGYEPVVTEW
jgi:hypothetical protein